MKSFALSALVATVIGMTAMPACADVTYDYTSQPLAFIDANGTAFPTGGTIGMELVVSDDGKSLVSWSILSEFGAFSSVTSQYPSPVQASFSLTTDANGQVSSWHVVAMDPSNSGSFDSYHGLSGASIDAVGSQAMRDLFASPGSGTWSTSGTIENLRLTAAVPEPATAPLLLAGVGFIAIGKRRRR